MFSDVLASKPSSEVTNIGDRLSLLADCECWHKIRIHVRNFGDSPEYYEFAKKLASL